MLNDLCCDVILGHDFQKQHESVTFQYEGSKPKLVTKGENSLCAPAIAKIDEPSLFSNMPEGCKPIAVKSRQYSKDDQLLPEGIIEPSTSPWRAQVVVVKDSLN